MIKKKILDSVAKNVQSWRLKNEPVSSNPSDPSGVSLLLLTEAPTTNIVTWMSPVRNSDNTNAVQRMTSTGYHNNAVWKSILFQLTHAMYILQKEKNCVFLLVDLSMI